MQATALLPPMQAPTGGQNQTIGHVQHDPLRASVSHLLSRAYNLPCSTAAQAFVSLVQPTARFQLALDALLPLLDSSRAELSQRILVSYILYALYAPHPISINPFHSALYGTFVKEKHAAVQVASTGSASDNEQLVWVLWKVLKGDGNDIGPYSPSTLARSPLPPKLRPANLVLDEETQTDKGSFDPFRDDSPLSADGTGSSGPQTPSPYSSRSPVTSTTSKASSAANATYKSPVTTEEDERTRMFSRGMTLLLAARDRVLTLSEQRTLRPLLPQLIDPPVITSMDLPGLIAHNPILAHPILVSLLTLLPSKSNPNGASTYLDVLAQLPPTLATLDVVGRLLRDTTPAVDLTTGGKSTIADMVRSEMLGKFVQQSVMWVDERERERREGLSGDDRFEKGVQNLCRFYNSLIKLGIVDPASDADSAEMAHFALRHSAFEDANALYRVLAMGNAF